MREDFQHVLDFQGLMLDRTFVVLGLIEFGHTDGHQYNANEAQEHKELRHSGHKLQIDLTAKAGQHNVVGDDGENYGNQIVKCSDPYADGGTLFRVIAHNGRKCLRSHILCGVSNDIDHIEHTEDNQSGSTGQMRFCRTVIHE